MGGRFRWQADTEVGAIRNPEVSAVGLVNRPHGFHVQRVNAGQLAELSPDTRAGGRPLPTVGIQSSDRGSRWRRVDRFPPSMVTGSTDSTVELTRWWIAGLRVAPNSPTPFAPTRRRHRGAISRSSKGRNRGAGGGARADPALPASVGVRARARNRGGHPSDGPQLGRHPCGRLLRPHAPQGAPVRWRERQQAVRVLRAITASPTSRRCGEEGDRRHRLPTELGRLHRAGRAARAGQRGVRVCAVSTRQEHSKRSSRTRRGIAEACTRPAPESWTSRDGARAYAKDVLVGADGPIATELRGRGRR